MNCTRDDIETIQKEIDVVLTALMLAKMHIKAKHAPGYTGEALKQVDLSLARATLLTQVQLRAMGMIG